MTIKDLQARVMETAQSKRWIRDINAKIAGIGQEIAEIVSSYNKLYARNLRPAYIENHVEDPRFLTYRIGKKLGDKQRKYIKEYREELADILIRALHLAGLLGLSSPAYDKKAKILLEKDEMIPVPSIDYNETRVYSLMAIYGSMYDHYRRKEMREIELDLRKMVHYLKMIAKQDRFRIVRLALEKDKKNRTRSWKGKSGN